MIKKRRIPANHYRTLTWKGDILVDFSNSANEFHMDGSFVPGQSYGWGHDFNGACVSKDGVYAIVFDRQATKGLIIKNGDLHREINRSYYHSKTYEYPVTIFDAPDGRTLLAHCPRGYDTLDLEDIETGEILTNLEGRDPSDFFHSRLQANPSGTHFLDAGWVWHPWDMVRVYNVEQALKDPTHLDMWGCGPDIEGEVSSARFMNDHQILISASPEPPLDDEETPELPPNSIGLFDMNTESYVRVVEVEEQFGNVVPINEDYCWDLFGFPKIIDLNTGKMVASEPEIWSGHMMSSIIHHHKGKLPAIAIDPNQPRIAVGGEGYIEVLWVES